MPMLDALKRSMLQSEYLKPEVVAGFDSYKYSCLDTSPLSQYVMHPFWNQVVKVCPGWIAPNVLTFAGFIWTVLVYLLLTIYDYSFEASSSMSSSPPVPSWVWLLGSWSIFLAHTLDGIDGKHARRTGTSSPLGELFDHGLDSWTTAIIPVCLYSIFGIQDYSATRLYFCLWNVLICFYLSHWEKYNTGLLYLPWSYDFSMLTCALVFLITGVLGHELWKVALPLINISVGTLFETMLYLGSMGLTLPLSALHVYLQPSPKHNLWEMHRPLLPLMGLLVSSSWWATHSPNGILDRDPRCFFFLTGTLFSNITCRLIIAQMSNTRAEAGNRLLLPLAAGVAAMFVAPPSLLHPALELTLLYALTLHATLAHLHFGVCVVRQMAQHLNIPVFSIRTKSQ